MGPVRQRGGGVSEAKLDKWQSWVLRGDKVAPKTKMTPDYDKCPVGIISLWEDAHRLP